MKKRILTLILFALALFVWIPLWMLLSASFMGSQETAYHLAPIFTEKTGYANWPILPQYPTLKSYIELILDSPEFFTMFWNSCGQVFPIIIGQILIGAPAAWAFAKFQFHGKKILYTLYIVLMLMPFQVTMVSSYFILNQLKLISTVWAIILPGIVSTFPVFLMIRFFTAIPSDLIEAASLDGANPWQIFLYLGLPLGAPGILSAVVLGFLEYWNALEQPATFLKDPSIWPLSLYLPAITTENAGISLTASIFMLTPALLIFLFGQNYLEAGIVTSGIKD